MSGLSQKRAFTLVLPMSALPPKADMVPRDRDVHFVPDADITQVQQSNRLPARLAVTGKVDYGVDDDTGRDGDQVRYEVEVDA